MIPLQVVEKLLRVSKEGGTSLVSLPLGSNVMGVIVKPEFKYIVDEEFIHINPLKGEDKYDLYLIIGSRTDVDEYLEKQIEGKVYMKLLDEFGDTVRKWDLPTYESHKTEAMKSLLLSSLKN
jgi:hypothetical protein